MDMTSVYQVRDAISTWSFPHESDAVNFLHSLSAPARLVRVDTYEIDRNIHAIERELHPKLVPYYTYLRNALLAHIEVVSPTHLHLQNRVAVEVVDDDIRVLYLAQWYNAALQVVCRKVEQYTTPHPTPERVHDLYLQCLGYES
jgi:hypothetical protein